MSDVKATETDPSERPADSATTTKARRKPAHKLVQAPGEVGGADGPEPTRYGDWSHKGICSDF